MFLQIEEIECDYLISEIKSFRGGILGGLSVQLRAGFLGQSQLKCLF